MSSNSDPLIVGDVNTLARAHADITLDDPVGLYIDSLQTTGWVTKDGSDPADYWQITRGTEDHALRAAYEVPEERGFTVSDVKINGVPITSPSQIAESIQVKAVGLAHRIGQNQEPPRPCGGGVGRLESLTAESSEKLPSLSTSHSGKRMLFGFVAALVGTHVAHIPGS
jgi:hypothetical protein